MHFQACRRAMPISPFSPLLTRSLHFSSCSARRAKSHHHEWRVGTSNEESSAQPTDGSLRQVDKALIEADSAVHRAEDTIEMITRLPSAYPPHPIIAFARKMVSRLLLVLIVCSVVYLLNKESMGMRILAAVVFPLLVGLYSLQKGSLSPSGALAAFFVGFGSFMAGFRCVIILLTFFISSSLLTKYKEKTKETVTAEHKKGGQRDWIQVFSNGFFATIFCLLFAFSTNFRDMPLASKHLSSWSIFLFGCVLGNYSCTCGDTWASELGVLSTRPARLITTLRPVHRGTNGGVTVLGLTASIAGGLFIGCSCFLATLCMKIGQLSITTLYEVASKEWPVIALGMLGGLIGSLIDSILGATLQYSGFDSKLKKVVNRPSKDPQTIHKISGIDLLSNNQVNLFSSLAMALATGTLTVLIFN